MAGKIKLCDRHLSAFIASITKIRIQPRGRNGNGSRKQRIYTLRLEQKLREDCHVGRGFQALALIACRSSFRYKPRRVKPSSRAAREMLPLCLRRASAI